MKRTDNKRKNTCYFLRTSKHNIFKLTNIRNFHYHVEAIQTGCAEHTPNHRLSSSVTAVSAVLLTVRFQF